MNNRVVVNLNAIKHNYQWAQNLAPSQNIMPVIKGNGYGLGAITIAKTLQGIAPAFAVSRLEEALELRESGIQQPILLLEGVFEPKQWQQCSACNFWVSCHHPSQIAGLQQSKLTKPLTIWLDIDIDMHRLGHPVATLHTMWQQLSQIPAVSIDVIMAHMPCANIDPPTKIDQFANQFLQSTAQYSVAKSVANSAAFVHSPASRMQWNRLGILLSGTVPSVNAYRAPLQAAVGLYGVVIAMRSIVCGEAVGYQKTWTATRDSIIATVSCGYFDGYPQLANQQRYAYINGQNVPIVGQVSTHLTTIDVTDFATQISIGDTAELIGSNIAIADVAKQSQTTVYEILLRLNY